jgi:hypothetical protein
MEMRYGPGSIGIFVNGEAIGIVDNLTIREFTADPIKYEFIQITDEGLVKHLAYTLWLERGCPIGSPEVDWENARKILGYDT